MKCKFILLILIFGLVVTLASSKIWDLDIWTHLRTGKYILENFKIPKADIYSYTAEGNPWINSDWLFGVVAYLSYRIGNFAGLVILKIILFFSIFYLLFRLLLNRSNYFLSIVLLFLTVLVTKERFVERPEIFSYLFIVIYLFILNKFRKTDTKLIWLLLPLQVLWTNFHTFSILGIVLIWVYIIGEYIGLKIKLPWDWNAPQIDRERLKILSCIGLWAILLSLLNPYGVNLFKEYIRLFHFLHLHLDIFPGGIVELRPPFLEQSFFSLNLLYYKILIVISQLSFLLNYRQLNLGNLFLYFLFLYFSMVAVRNIPLFAIVTLPMVAENLFNFYLRKKETIKKIRVFLRRASLGVSFLVIIFLSIYFFFDTIFSSLVIEGKIYRRFGFGYLPIHPVGAVDFLLKDGIRGNGFNNFGFGGYFIWRVWPELKVFIDGRTSVYAEDHLFFYADVFMYPYLFDQLVKDYNINYFLLDINSSKVLLDRLLNDKEWSLVFFDSQALIFLKNTLENREIIEKYRIDFDNWVDPEPEIEIKTSFRQKRTYPLSYFKKGFFFDLIGRRELARLQYQRAIKVNPYIAEIYNNLGATYQAEGNLEKALDYYEKALSVNPDLPSTHTNLGFIYEKIGKKEEAIREYKLAARGGFSAEAHNNLGCLYFEKGLYRKALRELKKAININPGRAEYHFNLGSVFQAMGLIDQAIFAFREATRLDPESVKAYNSLGLCYLAKNELKKAKRAFEKVLEIDPENIVARENLKKIQ